MYESKGGMVRFAFRTQRTPRENIQKLVLYRARANGTMDNLGSVTATDAEIRALVLVLHLGAPQASAQYGVLGTGRGVEITEYRKPPRAGREGE